MRFRRFFNRLWKLQSPHDSALAARGFHSSSGSRLCPLCPSSLGGDGSTDLGATSCLGSVSYRYWHGPLALLRLKLEAVPAEVPRSAFRVLCKHDVMSNWEFPLAGGLRRHLSSVKHRKNLHWLRCDCPEFRPVSTCEHSGPLTLERSCSRAAYMGN